MRSATYPLPPTRQSLVSAQVARGYPEAYVIYNMSPSPMTQRAFCQPHHSISIALSSNVHSCGDLDVIVPAYTSIGFPYVVRTLGTYCEIKWQYSGRLKTNTSSRVVLNTEIRLSIIYSLPVHATLRVTLLLGLLFVVYEHGPLELYTRTICSPQCRGFLSGLLLPKYRVFVPDVSSYSDAGSNNLLWQTMKNQ